jgi:hypothetical protein
LVHGNVLDSSSGQADEKIAYIVMVISVTYKYSWIRGSSVSIVARLRAGLPGFNSRQGDDRIELTSETTNPFRYCARTPWMGDRPIARPLPTRDVLDESKVVPILN